MVQTKQNEQDQRLQTQQEESKLSFQYQDDFLAITTTQIQQAIVSEHLATVPQDLTQAFDLAQQAKVSLYDEYLKCIIAVQKDIQQQNEEQEEAFSKLQIEVKPLSSQSFTAPRRSRKSKNLDIEERVRERRFQCLNFHQINKQWSMLKEARNTINILDKISEETGNRQAQTIKKLKSQLSTEVGALDSDESESDERVEFKMLRYHAQRIESDINRSLLQRLVEEQALNQIKDLEAEVLRQCKEEFNENFMSKQGLLHIKMDEEVQDPQQLAITKLFSFNNHIDGFWQNLDIWLDNECFNRIATRVAAAEITLPEFLLSHLRVTAANAFTEWIIEYQDSMRSSLESEWKAFLIEQRESTDYQDASLGYKPDGLDDSVLQAAFQILVVLPLRTEIKHNIELIEKKVMKAQACLNLKPKVNCTWKCSDRELDSFLKILSISLFTPIKQGVTLNRSLRQKKVFQLLFTVFNFFVATDIYDSADRHFMKVFLETCSDCFRGAIVSDKTTPINFFLLEFESMFGKRIPKDSYDIKQMLPFFRERLVEMIKNSATIDACSVLSLRRLSSDSTASKHCVICVQGFLQKNDDKSELWANAVKHFKHAEVFALTWNSCTPLNVLDNEFGSSRKTGTFSKILNFANIQATSQKMYLFAYDQAKVAGGLLAIFLLKSNFTDGRAVSLIGYSLGSAVIMHCITFLKTLYRKGFAKACKIIHDVHIWGGSYVLDPSGTIEEKTRAAYHCNIVSGRINNMWSLKDTVLKYLVPQMQPGIATPMGLTRVLLDVHSDVSESEGCKKAHNIQHDGDHHSYTSNCHEFLPQIDYAY